MSTAFYALVTSSYTFVFVQPDCTYFVRELDLLTCVYSFKRPLVPHSFVVEVAYSLQFQAQKSH